MHTYFMHAKFVNSTRMFVSANKPCGHRSSEYCKYTFLVCPLSPVCRQRQRMGGNRQKIADVHSRGTCDLLVFYLLDKTLVENRARSSVHLSIGQVLRLTKSCAFVRSCVRASCVRAFVRSFVQLYMYSYPVARFVALVSPVSRLPFPIPRP